MKKINAIALLVITTSFIFSCKKDAKQPAPGHVQSLEKGLVSFSANGQLIDAVIDTLHNTVIFVLNDSANFHSITINFALAGNVNAKINGTAAKSGAAIDFTKPVALQLTSTDGKRSTTFDIVAETELQYLGVGGTVLSRKSLNRSYNFYMDQFDGSPFEIYNCGPASTTMAIKWADSTFTKTPAYARTIYMSSGGWWVTSDVMDYLGQDNISNTIDTLDDLDAVVKRNIDAGNVLILCLDMYYVQLNPSPYQHTQKFYETNAVGWGHFILIKGYIQTSNGMYLEAYDPYSNGLMYGILTPGQLRGKDRYYYDYDIKIATDNWWPYAIIAAPKGKTLPSSVRGVSTFSLHKTVPEAKGR